MKFEINGEKYILIKFAEGFAWSHDEPAFTETSVFETALDAYQDALDHAQRKASNQRILADAEQQAEDRQYGTQEEQARAVYRGGLL